MGGMEGREGRDKGNCGRGKDGKRGCMADRKEGREAGGMREGGEEGRHGEGKEDHGKQCSLRSFDVLNKGKHTLPPLLLCWVPT